MNYIYDILINFKDELYDFYDWNMGDDILHIRKIPLFMVDSKILMDIRNHMIEVSGEFLKKIHGTAEVFMTKNVKTLPYASLFSDGNEVIGVAFNNKGIVIGKSDLLVDEKEEVLDVCTKLQKDILSYHILKKQENVPFKTRNEIKVEKYLQQELYKMQGEDAIEKLKYLYFEVYGEKEDDQNRMLKRLKVSLKDDFHRVYPKLYDFFKLTSIHK